MDDLPRWLFRKRTSATARRHIQASQVRASYDVRAYRVSRRRRSAITLANHDARPQNAMFRRRASKCRWSEIHCLPGGQLTEL